MEHLDYDRIERFWRGAGGVGETQQSARWGMPGAFIPYRTKLEERQLLALLEHVPDRGLAVDLGCGTGLWSAFLSRYFQEVIGVDFSEPLLRSAARAENILYRCESVVRFRLAERERVGLFFLGGVLMYLDDRDAAGVLRRCREALSEGGRVILRETVARSTRVFTDGEDYMACWRSRERYERLLAEAGFRVARAMESEGYQIQVLLCLPALLLRRGLGWDTERLQRVTPRLWEHFRKRPERYLALLRWVNERGLRFPQSQRFFFLEAMS